MAQMLRILVAAFVLFLIPASLRSPLQESVAQAEIQKPLNPDDPRLTYTFPIQPGRSPLRFQVLVDKTGAISGVSVFRDDTSQAPLQTLSGCEKYPDHWTETMSDADFQLLLRHADLNFDGFEDLELIQNYVPHLGKGIYCIYLWDSRAGQFHYSPQASDLIRVNPEPHPDNKTITVHEDWQGADWQDSTYRWFGDKLQLIEQSGLFGDWSQQIDGRCGYKFTCSRLVRGKMEITLTKPICSPDEISDLPDCPSAPSPPHSDARRKLPTPSSR